MKYIKFLSEKLKGYSVIGLLRLELESFLFFLASILPTTFGVFCRAILSKVFFKKCIGFAWIQPRVTFVHTDRLTVGSHFGVNTGTYINAVGGIEFGDYVLIGNNVTISSGKHPTDSRDVPIFSRQTIPMKIVIEDDVWIGAGAIIMPGIKIAKGTVVGANSIVTKDTNEYDIVVGSPAQFLRKRG